MNTSIQQPSRLIQSLCLEGISLKKQSKHRLDYLDLALNNGQTLKKRAANLDVITPVASKVLFSSPNENSINQNVITSGENSGSVIKNKKLSECNNYKNMFLTYIAPIVSFEGIYNKLLSPLRHNFYNTTFANEFVKDAMNCPILNAVKIPFQGIAFFTYKTINLDFDKLVCVIGPITEEILIRNLLQEQILKRIPSVLLGKVNKNYAEKIDKSLVVRISRVIMSSLIFANYHNSSKSYVWIDCFFAGLLLGGLQEVTGSTLPSTVAHIAHNTLEFYKIVNPLGNY